MKFNEPEVLELGEARELIQETVVPADEEGPVFARTKLQGAIYAEVLELGEARELIQETDIPVDEEGPIFHRTKLQGAIYVSEEE